MDEFLKETINFLETTVSNYPIYIGLGVAFITIYLESIIPILPSGVFIALNMILFKQVVGFSISYLGVMLGCVTSYWLFRKFFSNWINKKSEHSIKIKKLMKTISKMSLMNLTILLAFPFTPAFPINIAAGLSKMDFKKFFIACLISKATMVYFWGYVGTSLKDSITNPTSLINIVLILIVAFALSKLINKKMNIDV